MLGFKLVEDTLDIIEALESVFSDQKVSKSPREDVVFLSVVVGLITKKLSNADLGFDRFAKKKAQETIVAVYNDEEFDNVSRLKKKS